MFTVSKFIFLMLLVCPAILINAQTKDNIRSKLKKLDGEVTKITIQTDKDAVTFEGDEADYILRKMKKELKPKEFTMDFPEDMYFGNEDFFASDNDSAFDFKFDHLNLPNPPKVKFFHDRDDDEAALFNNPGRKITIEKGNGKTKVIVKRNSGDDQITETYEGDDAEKYLDELNKDEPFSLDFKDNDDDSGKKDTRIIIIK